MRLDMHELLDAARAGDPPMRHSTDDFVAGGRRRQARKRLTLAGSAAGLVLAVAAAAVVPQVFAGKREIPASDQEGAQFSVTAFSYTLAGYTVGDFEVSDPIDVTPGYQQSRIRRSGEQAPFDRGDGTTEQVPVSHSVLTVFRDGVFDPAQFRDAESVRVGAAAGFYAAADSALAWQYGADAWAVIRSGGEHLSRADMIRVAAAMRTGPSRPAALPWRMSYLPAGYHLSSMGLAGDDELTGAHLQRGAARFTREPEEYADLTQTLTGDSLTSLRVKVYPGWIRRDYLASAAANGASVVPSSDPSYAASFDPSSASFDPSSASFDPSMWPSYTENYGPSSGPSAGASYGPMPDDQPFCAPAGNACYRLSSGGTYVIEVTSNAGESAGELVQVLRGMRLDDPSDDTTWTGLGDAVPGVDR